jgi:DNA-binding IscR family transcriptional regulator
VRGPGGGVRFARSPREIHLWDILSAVEPANEFERCFLGLKPCSDLNSCPLHEDWAPIRAKIRRLLQTKNLWEFAAEARNRGVLCREPANRNANRQRSPCAEGQP